MALERGGTNKPYLHRSRAYRLTVLGMVLGTVLRTDLRTDLRTIFGFNLLLLR